VIHYTSPSQVRVLPVLLMYFIIVYFCFRLFFYFVGEIMVPGLDRLTIPGPFCVLIVPGTYHCLAGPGAAAKGQRLCRARAGSQRGRYG
jgi:hypothetical protein